ncbi:hypothetical protein XENORESO_009731 [Xenotaenia resolanae]|uniref:Uncharacterized protein n=1 Tax=Xenotaenia resolanae TaxID=208358 RepID=A0ABV0VPC4_9TELE
MITRSDMLTHRYLVLLWAFETASGVSLVTVRTQDLENKENLTCFKSADPGAVRATQLHGDHNDEGDLWSRDPNTSAPLPQCSSSSFSPPPSHCEVCLLEEVYMICDNLPARTKLFLERPGTPFSTKESACPTLPPADVKTLSENHCCSSGEKISSQFVFFTVFFVYIRGH